MTAERIMVVDDNTELLEELKEILALSGYEPLVISDSTVTLERARKFRPHVIILDLRMNQMNGFQVAKKLKQFKQTASIPIIAMSGYFPIEKDFSLLDLSDMSARLKKPFAISDLITQIENILSGNKNKGKESEEIEPESEGEVLL